MSDFEFLPKPNPDNDIPLYRRNESEKDEGETPLESEERKSVEDLSSPEEETTPPPSLEELEQMGRVDSQEWLQMETEGEEGWDSAEDDSREILSPESLAPPTSQFPSIEEPEAVEALEEDWFSWTGYEEREEEPPEEVRGNEGSVTSQAPPLPTEEASEELAGVESERTDGTPRLESSVLRARSDSPQKSSQPGLESSNKSDPKTPQEETSEEWIYYPLIWPQGAYSNDSSIAMRNSQLFRISLEEAEALHSRFPHRTICGDPPDVEECSQEQLSQILNVEENLETRRSFISRSLYEESRADLLGIDRDTLLNEPQFESFREPPSQEEDEALAETMPPRSDFSPLPRSLHLEADTRYYKLTGEAIANLERIPTFPKLLARIQAGLLREKALLEHNLGDDENINRILGSNALNYPQEYTQILRISNLLLENFSEEELQSFSPLENYEETTLDDYERMIRLRLALQNSSTISEIIELLEGKSIAQWKSSVLQLPNTQRAFQTSEFKIKDAVRGDDDNIAKIEGFDRAMALAHVAIATGGDDGAVVIEQEGFHYIFTLEIETDGSRGEFSREEVEEGRDEITLTGAGNNINVKAFVTIDGHLVTPNTEIGTLDSRSVLEGEAESTTFPNMEGYQAVLEQDLPRLERNEQINNEGYIALFRGLVKAKALQRLADNRQRIEEAKEQYYIPSTDNPDNLTVEEFSSFAEQQTTLRQNIESLREAIERDAALEAKEEELREKIKNAETELNNAREASAFVSEIRQEELSNLGGLETQNSSDSNSEMPPQTPSPLESVDGEGAFSDLNAESLIQDFNELGEPTILAARMNLTQLDTALNAVQRERLIIGQSHPASSLFHDDREKADDLADDRSLAYEIHTRFNRILEYIDKVEVALHEDKISLEDLDAVVTEVLEQIPRQGKEVIREYIDNQNRIEIAISFSALAVELGLGVAAFFTGYGILGIIGSLLGIGTAAVELNQAIQLENVAGSQEGGGQPLMSDPDAARFNYVMALANLALAGFDLVSTVDEGAAVLGALARNTEGTEVLARLDTEDLERLGRAIRDNDEELLDELRDKLGDDFDPAYDALQGVVDEGLHSGGSSSEELSRFITRLEGISNIDLNQHSITQLSDELIGIDNQIDIHPRLLETMPNEDVSRLLQVTRELEMNGGNVRAISPETKAIFQEFRTSNSYRLRFNVDLAEGDEMLNQILSDLDLTNDPKAIELFGNMTRFERIRIYNVLVNASYPSGASHLKRQAADYALSTNPTSVADFTNHFEMYVSDFKRISSEIADNYVDSVEARLVQFEQDYGRPPSQAERNAIFEEISTNILGKPILSIKRQNSNFKSAVAQRAEIEMGQANDLNRVSLQTRQRIFEAYQQKADALGSRIGATSVEAGLTDNELATAIQQLDEVHFSSKSAAVYHTQKHYLELPPTERLGTESEVIKYLDSANKTVKEGTIKAVNPSQTGGRTIEIFRSKTEADKRYDLTAFLYESQEGLVVLASYYNKAN
ncbi:hypothetical protein [Baaleninema simplex]|uniref:hypothetical protein n=1 Tax=Baaleninema simplex TaxID=2862350 RepID=UPI00034D6342|nr:hypothetical protein [Baaleninema simplex]